MTDLLLTSALCLVRVILLWLAAFMAGAVKENGTGGNLVWFATFATLFALSMGWLWP